MKVSHCCPHGRLALLSLMSLMSIDLVESSHRSEGTHGTLFCSTLVQEELRGLQVGEMLFSSCTAS